jgi:tetraacyldisaccharide 4'-kinase
VTTRRHPELLLRRLWEEGAHPLLGLLLSMLAVGYRVGLWAREWLYRTRLIPVGRLPCPVLSVGNVTLGGSGKTPAVELVTVTLGQLGALPAVVSRGYGRSTRGVEIVADREGVRLDPRAAGDEPVLLAEHLPGVPVVVGESRFDAGRVAIERCGATALVLDDGFQHRTVVKDLEILVVSARAPWGNGRLFPRGTLREPLSAIRRADLVVVTNPRSPDEVASVERTLRRWNDRAPVLAAAYRPTGAREVRSGRHLGAEALHGRRLVAFAGLASPRAFAETLESLGVRVTSLLEFPDHHWFTAEDLDAIRRHVAASGAEGLVTTEKDWMRVRTQPLPPLPLWVLGVRLALESGQEVWARRLASVLAPSGIPRR